MSALPWAGSLGRRVPHPRALDLPHAPSNGRAKDQQIQVLRGLAVLLLVGSHVYGLNSHTGLREPGSSHGHYLTHSLEYLRMPLFTVISGYVYALRPVTARGQLAALVHGKARRLLVPLVPLTALVITLEAAADTGSAPTVGDFTRGYLFGYSHLWFLYSIFLVFTVVGILGALGWLATQRRWALALGISTAAYVLLHLPDRFDVVSIDGALRLLPCFLLGYGIKTFATTARSATVTWTAVAVFGASFVLEQTLLLDHVRLTDLGARALGVCVGLSGVTCLFRVRHRLRSRLLAWIGTYAFTIYLFHTIANKATKVALDLAGVHQEALLFTTGLLAGVLAPIAFHVVLGRYDLVRILLLGEKPLSPHHVVISGSIAGVAVPAAPQSATASLPLRSRGY